MPLLYLKVNGMDSSSGRVGRSAEALLKCQKPIGIPGRVMAGSIRSAFWEEKHCVA